MFRFDNPGRQNQFGWRRNKHFVPILSLRSSHSELIFWDSLYLKTHPPLTRGNSGNGELDDNVARGCFVFCQARIRISKVERIYERITEFDLQTWYADASYEFSNFFETLGKTEMAILSCVTVVAGCLCMRGFKIRD